MGAPSVNDRLCRYAKGKPQLVLRTAVVTERWALPNGLSWNPVWFQSIAYVYRNTAALPRAFLVPLSNATLMPSAGAQLQTVLQPAFDSAHHLVYDPRGSHVPLGLGFLQDAWARVLRPTTREFPAGLTAGQARVISDTGNSVQVAVNAAAPSYLVLDDSYYPGWQVWIDGKPAAINRADYLLRSVLVPAGRHSLVFAYAPLSYLAGLAITLGTAVLVAVGLAWPMLRRRRQARDAATISGSSVPSSVTTVVSPEPAGSAAS
jgi:hypothetical protein